MSSHGLRLEMIKCLTKVVCSSTEIRTGIFRKPRQLVMPI